MKTPYFQAFEERIAPFFPPLSARRRYLWHALAGAAVAAGGAYLHWRWMFSLNEEALAFSVLVAAAETLFFLGTLLFYFDVWDEEDTPRMPAPENRKQAGLDPASGALTVDIFITTYDEPASIVAPSVDDALCVKTPANVQAQVWLLDDGDRGEMASLAAARGVRYLARGENTGFKAGNLRNGLLHSSGDFLVICDADTRLFPSFLENTLGYFRDPKVAWVQTPHWFYDVPEGELWEDWVSRKIGRSAQHWMVRHGAALLRWFTGQARKGADPFLSDPRVFFDVIQRRRNRNAASFCCGAASVHRREAVFEGAIKRKARAIAQDCKPLPKASQAFLPAHPLEPYRFHVSEDLYTSILLQEDAQAKWRSVYHPQVEAKMLSPMSVKAWAAQRLKYAGGTFDIALRDNPLFRRGLSWRQKLHYAATFWAYFGLIWAPVLLIAPMISLVSGVAPLTAYSADFFRYFIPAVLLAEWAMLACCKGHPIGPGRALGVAALPVHLRAFLSVLRGRTPKFAPTPKLPLGGGALRYIAPHIALLLAMTVAGVVGCWRTFEGHPGFSPSLLWVNLFWLTYNMLLIARLLPAAFWSSAEPAVPTHPSHQRLEVSYE